MIIKDGSELISFFPSGRKDHVFSFTHPKVTLEVPKAWQLTRQVKAEEESILFSETFLLMSRYVFLLGRYAT